MLGGDDSPTYIDGRDLVCGLGELIFKEGEVPVFEGRYVDKAEQLLSGHGITTRGRDLNVEVVIDHAIVVCLGAIDRGLRLDLEVEMLSREEVRTVLLVR